MKRVLIIADHAFVEQAIRLALRQSAEFQVVGFLDGRGPGGAQLRDLRPDVVIVDDMENPDDALDRLREVGEATPDATALILTMRRDQAWIYQATEAGAQAALSKRVHPAALGTLLHAAGCGFSPRRGSDLHAAGE